MSSTTIPWMAWAGRGLINFGVGISSPRVQEHWQCKGYNVDIWESLEKGLNPISAGHAGHCLVWRQNQPRSHLFCQMFACLVLRWKFWVSLGCLLPWWTPTGDNFLRSNLCLAHYNQFKLVFWPVPCEQGELLIACLSTVSLHMSQDCCISFQLPGDWTPWIPLKLWSPLSGFSDVWSPLLLSCVTCLCTWWTSISKAVSTVLFNSIISFEIKYVRKATAWPTASVCFCWRSEGHYCHLMTIGFNPDCISPSLLTVLIIRTGDKQGLKWISFLALFIWTPGRWWFTFCMILRTGIHERWNDMNYKRTRL